MTEQQLALIKEAKDPAIVGLTPKQAVAHLLCLLQDCAEALEQAETAQGQEPVAWVIWTHGPVLVFMNKDEALMEFERLNTAYPERSRKLKPLYTTPPAAQRQWVGLTRSECLQIEKDMMKYYDYQHECKTVCLPEFARAIEAKLKEKNGF